MQVTARTSKQPLDSMTTETHFTTITRPSDISDFPEGGRYIHGLFLEGAERERRRRELVPEGKREGVGWGRQGCGKEFEGVSFVKDELAKIEKTTSSIDNK